MIALRLALPLPALPGLALSLGIAAAAMGLRSLPGLGILSPAILAIFLGLALRPVLGFSASLRPGIALSVRTLLRTAVVLLGLQVTLGQVAALGLGTVVAVVLGLVACMAGTLWLGKVLGVAPRLARLIAIGTSVCGASAVVAGNSVIRGDEEDVAYALAAVTVFGTLTMLVWPLVAMALGLPTTIAGLWLGSSIHEVAQVVGAATQLGDEATRVATVAKMARVLMLAPVVLTLAAWLRREGTNAGEGEAHARVPVPWFVFGFLALAGIASLGIVPAPVVRTSGVTASFLLAAALGGMGFALDVRELRRKGIRPLLLAAFATLLIAVVSLSALTILGRLA